MRIYKLFKYRILHEIKMIENKRRSNPMISRLKIIIDRLKDHFNLTSTSDKFMECKYNPDEPDTVDNLSEHELSRSKSHLLSRIPREDSLYFFKDISSNDKYINERLSYEKLNDTSDVSEDDEREARLIMMNDYISNYNLFHYNPSEYEFKTQEVNSSKIVYFRQDILDYQGQRHSPDEIAPIWKKDCRTWLWKSVRLAKKRRKMQIADVISQTENEKLI